MFPYNKASACSIENIHYEDNIQNCPNDKEQTASKLSDQQVQTNDVTLLTEQEEDILFLIRNYKIRIDEIATLAYGMMYNYSKKRYTVDTEEIFLSSDDDDDDDVIEIIPAPEPSEGLLAGLEFSALNKQIMNLVNSTSERQNVTLLLLKILKVLIQDRSIVYGNQIMNMIEEQCQKIELDSNDNETRPNIRQTVSTGVNTDLTGDIDRHGTLSISPKRKQMRTRTEIAAVNKKLKEKTMTQVQPQPTHNQQAQELFRQFVPEPPAQQHHEPQQYDQLPFMHQMHYQENLVPNFSTPQSQEAIVNVTQSVMNQPQSLNQIQQHYSQRFLPNTSYGPHLHQSSIAAMRPHTMTSMNPPAMSAHPPAMPAHPPVMSSHPTAKPAHPPAMSAHPTRAEIPALRPPPEHYVEEYPLSLVNRMSKVQNINQLPPNPAIPPKPIRPGMMPAPVFPAPVLRRRDSIDLRHPGPSNTHQLRYDPLIQASTSAENSLSAHNVVNQPHQMAPVNPLIGNNHLNASPMRMQQNLSHPRLPSAMAWDAQMHHTLPQNTPYNQNSRMYDTYGRYQ